ncbi:hypothetical protein Moror_1715 [Moniliophthora roreri MCA 2997]|uniref:F-box domain-containing protein n=1 Tax=Moniliophthora roreri (strain MCA 2997) TaxID=1381753 RepID=V2YP26_MONRO|nr:hypothetical protein Moror_1715 [Moniliophthora roreri MCA 2997]
MGIFNLFHDLSSSSSVEHNVSFDLAMPQSSRPIPLRRIPISSSTNSMTRMPLEIVMNIMEVAYDDADLEQRKSFLKSCSLVCREWSMPAQKQLFRHVSLGTQTACLAFKVAVDPTTERGRVLGSSVFSMRVSIDHNQPFGLSQRTFAHAVSLCPNLFQLNLALYGCGAPGKDIVGSPDSLRMRRPAPSFDEETLALLRSGPRISSLCFRNWSENSHSIMQLLGVWPTLQSLVISGTAPELPSPAPEPFPCALSSLQINFQASPSVDFFKWLLHNSSDSLRKLEFERELSPVVLNYLIDTHSATLESVVLPTCSRETSRALGKCEKLRHYSVEDALSSTGVYKRLSENIECIGFGLNKDTQLQTILDIIKARESIKAVTVNLWNGGELHRQLASLKTTCALRGIDLELTQDIRAFRSITRASHLA